jgi:peptidoglycan/LPS O-acetylase OafA/YrhL
MRRPDLQGLRGLAVLLVVCFHAGLPGFGGAFVAVDVFFVLSGFFLTTTLARRIATGDELAIRDVIAKRVWRLLPAMALVALATLASAMWLYAPIDRAQVADYLRPVAFFAGNLSFAATGVNYFHAGENPYLHTWTLGVEWQLALLLPALVAFLAAYGKRRAGDVPPAEAREAAMRTVFTGLVIAGAGSFVVATIVNGIAPMWAYFGPHTRLWAFAAGGAMAFFAGGGQSAIGRGWRIPVLQLLGIAMLFGPAFLYSGTMQYPGLISLVPVGGALLLLGGGTDAGTTFVGRALGMRPLAWLGGVSYAWYLWHWPAMVLAGVLFPGAGPLARMLFGVLAIVPAVFTQRLLAGSVNEYVVTPALRTKPFAWAIATCAVLFGIATMAAASSRAYVANSEHRVFAAARADHMAGSCWARHSETESRSWGDGCAFGDANSGTTVALLGDSHAEHWLAGLDRAGKERGWRVESYVMGACPAVALSGYVDGDKFPRYAGCLEYRDASIERVIARKPSLVILSNSDYYLSLGHGEFEDYRVKPDVWADALRRTYKLLTAAGLKVVVIRDVPLVPFDVPSCLSRRAAQLPLATDCTFSPDRVFQTVAHRAQDVAAFGLGVRFVDMNDHVCTNDPCATMRNGMVLYTDDDHITATFAHSLGGVLGERIAAAAAAAGPNTFERITGHALDAVALFNRLRP